MIDLSEVNTPERTEALERGWYGARIIWVERKPYHDGRRMDPNDPTSKPAEMLVVKVALDEPFDDVRAKENFNAWHPDPSTRKKALQALGRLAKAVNFPPQFDEQKLVGCRVNVLIEPSTWTDQNGDQRYQYDVRAYKPHESASNSSSQSAPPRSQHESSPQTQAGWF